MSFTVSNGVRQGGVLSPILFTVYLDDLLNELKRLNVGCHWRHHFVGALCYADYIALLAPSADALRQMLKVCENFASLHGLSFNPAKTQLIRFARSPLPFNICISFYDKPLSLVHSATHLGHTLTSDLSDDMDIQDKTKDMIKKANYSCIPSPVVISQLELNSFKAIAFHFQDVPCGPSLVRSSSSP